MSKHFTRETSIILIMALMLLGVMAFGAAEVNAASKKPGRPVVSLTKNSVGPRIKWTKARNAQKYQVYVKVNKGKWKKKATIKEAKKGWASTRHYLDRNYKYGTTAYYKVRALNGKKKGKFSKILKYYKPSKAAGKVGATVTLGSKKMYVKNCKLTKVDEWHDRVLYDFKKNGIKGDAEIYNDRSYMKITVGKVGDLGNMNGDAHMPFSCSVSDDPIIRVNQEDVVLYWTLDGTSPEIGQEDLFGDTTGRYLNLDKMQMRGTTVCSDGEIRPWVKAISQYEEDYEDVDGKKPYYFWAKAYKNGEYICELVFYLEKDKAYPY